LELLEVGEGILIALSAKAALSMNFFASAVSVCYRIKIAIFTATHPTLTNVHME